MTAPADLCLTWSETPKTGFLASWLKLQQYGLGTVSKDITGGLKSIVQGVNT